MESNHPRSSALPPPGASVRSLLPLFVSGPAIGSWLVLWCRGHAHRVVGNQFPVEMVDLMLGDSRGASHEQHDAAFPFHCDLNVAAHGNDYAGERQAAFVLHVRLRAPRDDDRID